MKKITRIFSEIVILALVIILNACTKKATPEPDLSGSVVKDIDGNQYDVISIGSQKWTKQNLRTSHYKNGQVIPQVSDPALWSALTTGAWCWYNNDSTTYAATYGKLYNWYAVNDPRGLAPESFHIPDDVEWTTLSSALGGNTVSGGAMKETGLVHWLSPNASATNSSNFTGLPSGFRNSDGTFNGITYSAPFWSATIFDAENSYIRELFYLNVNLLRNYNFNKNGFAVRCVRN